MSRTESTRCQYMEGIRCDRLDKQEHPHGYRVYWEDHPVGWAWASSSPKGLWYNSSRDDPLLHETRDKAIVALMLCWVRRQFRRMIGA